MLNFLLQGAYAGLIIGLIFMFWIGIGAYVTEVSKTIPKAPVSYNGCNWNLTTTAAPVTANVSLSAVLSTVSSTVSSSTMNVTEAVTSIEEHE